MTDNKRSFSLEAWIDQLRFEAQAVAGTITSMISWALLLFVFVQIGFALSLLPMIAMPVQAVTILFVVVAISVFRLADSIRERYFVVQEFRSILADVFLSGISVEEVAQRYQKLKLWANLERGWWGFKPRPPFHPKT